MRDLTWSEVDQVSGGAVNFVVGGISAGFGGLVTGGSYAVSSSLDGSFSWGQFATTVVHGTATGFLLGTGGALIYAGATGAIPGATVAGASVAGAGAALGVAGGASGAADSEGGGSD